MPLNNACLKFNFPNFPRTASGGDGLMWLLLHTSSVVLVELLLLLQVGPLWCLFRNFQLPVNSIVRLACGRLYALHICGVGVFRFGSIVGWQLFGAESRMIIAVWRDWLSAGGINAGTIVYGQ